MKKLLRNSGIVLVSIIIIVIIKILVHYFIFPNIGASFNTEVEGNIYHTISNPDHHKYDPSQKGECEDGVGYDVWFKAPGPEQQDFYEDEWKYDWIITRTDKAGFNSIIINYDISYIDCNRSSQEIKGLRDVRNWKRKIHFYHSSFLQHIIHSIDLTKGSGFYQFRVSDIQNGTYLTNENDIETGFKSQSKLYLFIIPIYILLYWLVAKYYLRKE